MSWTDEQLGVMAGSEEIEIETTDAAMTGGPRSGS
jgi:hypothetical protein